MSNLEHPRITEVGRLLAENDRLREALEKIIKEDQYWGLNNTFEPGKAGLIAIAALAKEAGQS